MSLKAAKQLYTKKKNSLNLFIERVETLLADQSVSTERLEGTKRKLNDAWEAFDIAYDGLVDIQIEDETQAADKGEKDDEQVNLKARVVGFNDNLDGTIAQRSQDREVQQLQHEKQAEV